MSEKLYKGSSLSVPLLSECKNNDQGYATDEENVIASNPSTTKPVSFFSTCLNGLNAISGFFHYQHNTLHLAMDFMIFIGVRLDPLCS